MANYTCEICGSKHPSVRELNTHLLSHCKIEREQERKQEISSRSLQDKRDQVEIARLDKELANINTTAPNKEAEYWQKLLDLQQKHFDQLLTMNKEIEALKAGVGDDDSLMPILEQLLPYLPQILNKTPQEAPGSMNYAQSMNSQEVKKIPTKEEQLEEYVKKIKAGEITEDQAYKIFMENPDVPEIYKKASKKRFHQEFLKIKNEK